VRLAVVIPCYRQERWLQRTVRALERGLEGQEWEGVLVRAAQGGAALPRLGPRWRVIDPRFAEPLTPGAARMLGLSATRAPWVLFCDADVEVEDGWLDSALSRGEMDAGWAGVGGRLEEWFEDGARERSGVRDLYRFGESDREVPYLATLALYRRDALLAAGGYEPRLASEEDYELGMRLRRGGRHLWYLGRLAGRHWSEPRPSWGELRRRWRTGLCFGQGQVLRLYLGRPGLTELLGRQKIYLAMLAGWLAGAVALVALPRSPAPLATWAAAALILVLGITARKRSLRLGLFSLLTWQVNAAGLVRGFLRGPVRAPAPRAEQAP
jgi:hypothetical protein